MASASQRGVDIKAAGPNVQKLKRFAKQDRPVDERPGRFGSLHLDAQVAQTLEVGIGELFALHVLAQTLLVPHD